MSENENEMIDFVKTLDPAIQDDKSWEKFKSPQELAKSYTELQKLVGQKGDIPKNDATPEEWGEFYGKIGRPEKAVEYDIKPLEGLVGGEARLNSALELAHEAGLTKTQADKLFGGLMTQELADLAGIQDIQQDNLKTEQDRLQTAWGNSFDEMSDSVVAFEKSFGIFDAFESKGLNADADVLMFMADIAKQLGESESINVASTNTAAGLDESILEITSQIREYAKKGEAIPDVLKRKKSDLFAKRYN